VSTPETEHQTNTFSNENVNVVVTKLPHCRVKFDIKIQPPALQAAYAKAAKNVKKEVSLPGFRKGKAPDQLINEKYTPIIQREWVDLVVETGFNEAIQLTHLYPIKNGMLKRPVVHKCDKETGAHFEIEFETAPQVPHVNPQELSIHRIKVPTITEKETSHAIKQLALRFATYEPLTDRAVEADDFIDIDVDVIEGETPRRVIENQRTQVNDEGIPSWLRSKVIGLKKGETAEGHTEQTEQEAHHADFKSVPFRVTVNEILQGVIPPIDDELAKKVGLTSLEELKTKVLERMEKEAHEQASAQEINQLEQALIQKYAFELPGSLIEKNKQARLENYQRQLSQEGQNASLNANQIDNMVEQSTIQQLQLLFLLRQVAEENQIEVQSEDVSQELNHQMALMSSGNSALDFQGDKEVFRERLYSLALDRKIKQFLLDKATFIEQ
jgi:trigger factor